MFPPPGTSPKDLWTSGTRPAATPPSHLQARAEALAAQVRANTAREALLGWHAWVAAQRAQRAKMMQAVMRVSDLRLCWAFGEWRARAAEKGLEQERLQRAKR